MGIAKNGYYSSEEIRSHDAQYNIIYSTRSDGKSYDIKYYSLRDAWKTKKASVGLIRRYERDITTEFINKYFVERGSNPIPQITGGSCDTVDYFRGYLWFSKTGHDGKITHVQKAGEVFALSLVNKRYKSTGHPELKNFIFEEFMTNDGYLQNEPDKLMSLISTCARKDEVRVFMIGNSVSRVCPYFKEWGLSNIRKQKIGTIDDYYHYTGYTDEQGQPEKVKISVEYSNESPKKSKMFFGRTSKSIQGGAWETGEYPILPGKLKDYDIIYELTYISVSDFKFSVKLIVHKKTGHILTYIYPAKVIKERVITGAFDTDPFVSPTLKREIAAECMIHNCFIDNKVVYSDNLTGDDFKHSCEAEVTYPF